MRYGYCLGTNFLKGEASGLAIINGLAGAGFDYVELPLSGLAEMEPPEIAKVKKHLQHIPCRACNVFFPGWMPLVGPEMNIEAIDAYLDCMMPLAADLGVENLVFGNGGARKIPEGASREAIWADLRKIVEVMEVHAKKHGIPISVEPLNFNETNIINSYGEAVALTEGLKHVATMIDSYHTAVNGHSYDDVYKNPHGMWHLHTAYPTGRMVPSPEDDMSLYADFVQMVKAVGYSGKISVEGALRASASEPAAVLAELRACLNTLKGLFE